MFTIKESKLQGAEKLKFRAGETTVVEFQFFNAENEPLTLSQGGLMLALDNDYDITSEPIALATGALIEGVTGGVRFEVNCNTAKALKVSEFGNVPVVAEILNDNKVIFQSSSVRLLPRVHIDGELVNPQELAVYNPHIGKNGNWFVQGRDTGVKASVKGDKGEKGDTGAPLTWKMLTEEQKAELKGDKGDQGIQGIKGDTGADGGFVELAPCGDLGCILENGVANLSWTDPEDVVINNATVARWAKTVLVQKQGDYPQTWNDGTVVAETSKTLSNKNFYRDNTARVPTGYFYKLFSMATNEHWNNQAKNVFVTETSNFSWSQVRQIVRAGRGAEVFPVGTVFVVEHSEYHHTDGTGLWFRVNGHDNVQAQDETIQHIMGLDLVDCLPFTAPYDYTELEYAITADTSAWGDKSYYVRESDGTYRKLILGTDYEVGDGIYPYLGWYERNVVTNPNRWSAGSPIAEESNQIQWLNSDGKANEWYTPSTIFDRCFTVLLQKNGFLRYLDKDFLSVVINAKLDDVWRDHNGTRIIRSHYAKFWALPSSKGAFNYTTNAESIKYAMNGNVPVAYHTRTDNNGYLHQIGTNGVSSNRIANELVYFHFGCIIG